MDQYSNDNSKNHARQKMCKNCSSVFDVTENDVRFLEKFEAPVPEDCPVCRSQRRIAWRNERSLYNRKCDLTGKSAISIYPPESPFPVYETGAWWSDDWDGMEHGRDFDFSREFFPQFMELFNETPRMALHVVNNENSPYVNQAWHSRSSYLCFDLGFSEDCYYCYTVYHSKDLMDSSFCRDCQLSYYLIDCQKCYGCVYLQECGGCYDAYFSYNCRGCNNVAFCSNLRNKKYHIFNKPVSKEEWEQFIKEFKEGSYETFKKYEDDFKNKVLLNAIRRADHNVNTENVRGDYLVNVKNAEECYVAGDSEDIYRCTRLDEQCFDCFDVDHASIQTLGYNGCIINGNNVKYTVMSINNSDIEYCHTLISCSDCFGCCSIKNKKFCIFNKQYPEDEYRELRKKIIDHMKKTGEYGNFFPVRSSPFEYNTSYAHERFPMTKEEVLSKGWRWRDKDQKEYSSGKNPPPDKISEVDDNLHKEIFSCEVTGKNFKIIPQELSFYRKLGLPLPRRCPDQRHLDRIAFRNPYEIWNRNCAKCGVSIETSYSPERPETVYCKKCYLGEVF